MNLNAARRERAVLAETIQWFRADPSHFDPEIYIRPGGRPGPYAASTCAVGGVEQAIWRVLDADVSERRALALRVSSESSVGPRDDHAEWAYDAVMGRLNRLTLAMYAHPGIEDIEDLAMGDDRDDGDEDVDDDRDRMLAVLDAALAELDRTIAAAEFEATAVRPEPRAAVLV